MKGWLKLTSTDTVDSHPVWVNMNKAISFNRDYRGRTYIAFEDYDNGMSVKESPEDVFDMLQEEEG